MDYGQYTLGRVVKHRDCKEARGDITREIRPLLKGMFGHIIGFSTVEYDPGIDVVLKVKWCTGEEYSIHPANVELL